ncbi:MAG: hypothetical protein V7720_07295 [Halioglobus sp.]
MNRFIQSLAVATVFPVVLMLLPGEASAQSMRFDCGTEEIAEEGACVLGLFDIEVVVSSSGLSSINTLSIRMGDADVSATDEVDGIVYRAEIADLNADGRPEVFAYVSSAGSGSYGSIVGYVVGENLELSPIALPDLGDSEEASTGYMGHDEFTVVESSLLRRFPLYHSGDVNAAPTGGSRSIAYKLGKASDAWVLSIASIDDY